MAKIKFSTGQVVNFSGQPTQADIEEVANKLGISNVNNKSNVNNSVGSSGIQGGTETVDTYGALAKAKKGEGAISAGLKATANIPSSAFNLAKSIGSAVIHPIKTVKGIIGLGAGIVEKAIPGKQSQEKYADAVGQYFKERYGSLENAQRTATNDPFGFGADIMGVITGGAGLVGKTAQVSKAISTVAKPVTKVSSIIGKGIGAGIKEATTGAAGIATGVGKEAFTQALANKPGFKQALRGKVSDLDIVNQAKQDFSTVAKMRSAEYKNAMSELVTKNPQALETTPIYGKLKTLAQDFNIQRTADGAIDLSRSPLAGREKQIQAVVNIIDDWGSVRGDRTIAGVDLLKKQLREFRQPTDGTLTKFVDELTNSTREIAGKVPGYDEVMTKYGTKSDFLDELNKTLSLGENKTPDQAVSKMNSLLRDNADYRRLLANELQQYTGSDVLSKVAGKALSKAMPQGLAKYVAGGGAFFAPNLIPMLAFTSPRLMGETFRILGITGRAVGGVLSDINNFRVANGLKPIKEVIKKIEKKYQETPNKQGGFIKNPLSPSKIESSPTKFYHGTSAENASKINTEGFKTGVGNGVSGQASNDFIYATESKTSAGKYVSNRLGIKNPTTVSGNFKGKILEIQGKMADFEAFGEVSKKLGVPLGVDSQGTLSMLDMPAIKKAMQEQGYGAIRFSDKYANGSKALAILPDQIKTKSQLTDIWNKANKLK
jgi:hypothetical protein